MFFFRCVFSIWISTNSLKNQGELRREIAELSKICKNMEKLDDILIIGARSANLLRFSNIIVYVFKTLQNAAALAIGAVKTAEN